jgi:hypothetical protein
MLRFTSVRRSFGYVVFVVVAAAVASLLSAGVVLAMGDANRASCSGFPGTEASPGFRGFLPDCRAYELVSPEFSNGFLVEMNPARQFSADGNLVFARSFGTFGGGTNTQSPCGDPYLLTRTAAGWTTIPLSDAPLTEFAFAPSRFPCELAISDSGAALIEVRNVARSIYASELYLRNADGSRVPVGPLLPPTSFPPTPTGSLSGEAPGHPGVASASNDLSHVLFSIEALGPGDFPPSFPPSITTNLWHGDTTVVTGTGSISTPSLYEYVGTGNSTPRLVGVDNEGKLISQCGTLLGGVAGNRHNAMSIDGSVSVFTAKPACPGARNGPGAGPPVAELFARIGGTTTAAISEPSPNSGCATLPCRGAPPADANFEGASADGSKVFFTSTQQLLDSATEDSTAGDSANPESGSGCGGTAGANGCNLYEYDFNKPAAQRLALVSGGDSSGLGPEVQGVTAVSEDGSHVYFVAKGVLAANAGAATDPITRLLEHAVAGTDNLYVYERDASFPEGRTTFVATLAPSDSEQWGPGAGSAMNVTGNGRFLVFTSTADLTLGDTSTAPQVFRYDAATEQLVRVSVGEEGFNNNGNTSVAVTGIPRPSFYHAVSPNTVPHPAVSNDGRVVFSSSGGLTPQAINNQSGIQNAYEYNEGHVYLISDGRDAVIDNNVQGVFVVGISASGQDVLFLTHDQLVPQDGNTLPDIYDARSGGGFPPPVIPEACQGDPCQGQPGAPPGLATPASATFSGTGNLTPPPPPPPPPPVKALTRAQKLAKALKACHSKHNRHKRTACEAQARKRYGPVKAKKARHTTTNWGAN